MMLGAALHMLLKRNHLVGILEVLIDIIRARDFLLIQFDHFLLHTLEVVRDIQTIDKSILMCRYEFGEGVDGLKWIFDAEVIDQPEQ